MHNIFLLLIIILIIICISLKTKQYKESFSDIKFSGPNIIQTWKNNVIPDKYKTFVERVKKLNPNSKNRFFQILGYLLLWWCIFRFRYLFV